MNLKTYFLGLPKAEREDFAARCGTTVGHMANIAYGCKPCGETLAINIERESGRKILVEAICPAPDWAFIRGTRKLVDRAVAA